MAGDPFGLLLRQRIVFLGGEASPSKKGCRLAAAAVQAQHALYRDVGGAAVLCMVQVVIA